uniref:Uncharacterized protein n=1 Tax=Triticum urartu TaxID=4572 RepID=A0A8R7JVE5_TRIUA
MNILATLLLSDSPPFLAAEPLPPSCPDWLSPWLWRQGHRILHPDACKTI